MLSLSFPFFQVFCGASQSPWSILEQNILRTMCGTPTETAEVLATVKLPSRPHRAGPLYLRE